MRWRLFGLKGSQARLVALLVLALLALGGQWGDRPQGARGSGDEETDDLERNGRLLRKWKTDPEHYARLQHDLQVFHALPPERRQQLRQFDHELHSLDPQTQRHLWEVLERYTLWYERLPEDDRKQLEEAPTPQVRVQEIRKLKEKQWLERLPRHTREKLEHELINADGNPGERAAVIARYKAEEKQRRLRMRLQIEPRPPAREKTARPARMEALPGEVKAFVEKELRPRLNAGETRALEAAEGRWPNLVLLIQDLAERHSLRPLPGPRELWETAASALPEVPDRVLKEFALTGLTAEERTHLNLSYTDPDSRERLTRVFFEKKPRELQRYRKQARQALSAK